MTLADDMKTALEAQEKQDKLDRLAANIAEESRKLAFVSDLKKDRFSKDNIAKEIKKQAGKPQARINVYQWEDSRPYWQWEILAHIKLALIELGFNENNIKNEFHSMEPVGSDPLFWNTVYDLDVVVTF